MILKEFFSRPLDIAANQKNKDASNSVKADDLFWSIIDDDDLYKTHFFPVARQVKTLKHCPPEKTIEMFMPMVKEGCKKYYKENKLEGKLEKLFTKDIRETLCHRLYDHYVHDIKSGKYNLGQ